jgi:hypothetical protein
LYKNNSHTTFSKLSKSSSSSSSSQFALPDYQTENAPKMSSTDTQDHADGHALTPNTLNDAEAAFTFNSTIQTSSAGRPQPTTPPTSDGLLAPTSAPLPTHLAPEPPYPSDGTEARFLGHPGSSLSRGTTQAVLQKMDSIGIDGAELGRRASLAKEGEKRTAAIPVPSSDEAGGKAGGAAAAAAAKPGIDRRQSWSKEDYKRVASERLMGEDAGTGDGAGYTSKG